MIRRELSPLLGFAIATTAGREHDGARADRRCAVGRREGRRVAGGRRLELEQRVLWKCRPAALLESLAQRLRDRVARAIADLEKPLAARAAAAGEAIPAVRACELDPELLEPVDRGRRFARQHLDEAAVGGVVRAAHDVLRMDLGGVVRCKRSLDAALRLRRVARLERRLRSEPYPGAAPFGGDGRREACSTAADHEHVEGRRLGHRPILHAFVISVISFCYSELDAPIRARDVERLDSPDGNARRCRQP